MNRPIPIARDATGSENRKGLMVLSCEISSYRVSPQQAGRATRLFRYFLRAPAPVKTGIWNLYTPYWRIIP